MIPIEKKRGVKLKRIVIINEAFLGTLAVLMLFYYYESPLHNPLLLNGVFLLLILIAMNGVLPFVKPPRFLKSAK